MNIAQDSNLEFWNPKSYFGTIPTGLNDTKDFVPIILIFFAAACLLRQCT